MFGDMTDAPPIRAFGRSLADFGNLLPAERRLLEACQRGEMAEIAETLPEAATETNRVRAGFVRFLALGGDTGTPLHEKGILLSGAWIDNLLDLNFCILPAPLSLRNCRLKRLEAREALLPRLALAGSHVESGINADGIRVTGSIFLNTGFHASGAVRLLGANIGGNLECRDARFENMDGAALAFDRATIVGNVFVNGEFAASGEVRLLGATIGGSFECSGGNFEGKGGHSLSCDRATIAGSMFMSAGFTSNGSVRLLGTHISGNLECQRGSFEAKGGNALSLDRAVITGGMFLSSMSSVKGDVVLDGTKIGALNDSEACWPEPGQLVLDGIRISRLGGKAPTDGKARVRWLQRQRPSHLNDDFKPQPWEETIRVLREMGHDEDARVVAIAKQDQLRIAAGMHWPTQWRRPLSTRLLDGKNARFSPAGWLLHGAWKWLAGYGYRPLRLVGWMAGVWLAAAVAFQFGMVHAAFAPSNPVIHANADIAAACRAGPDATETSRWTRCSAMPDAYTTFQPLFYSLDLILPLVELQQDSDWAPVVAISNAPYWTGIIMRWVMWFEILFGWMASLMLVAILTNLVKKD